MERYEKVKQIGEGSFGKALLVRRVADNKQCVMKLINISRMGPKEREESRKEVKVLSRLKHPNIVSYQESFEEIGNLHIIMDYCEAGDLYQRIVSQRGAHFSESQVLDWFVQLCLALKHIHDRKILHRDIKSQNIFLTRHSIVKLGDFGIARVLKSTMELARTCIGTPYYLSPEICENRPYNNKSDVWSLGCVLYELTTLKHAFEAGSMKNLVLKIIRGSYPPVPTRYSGDLRALVAHCFKRIPNERPSVTAILRKPFIQNRIKKFLSPEKIEEEFSHTVLHQAAPKASRDPSKIKQIPPRAPVVGGKKPHDLAAVYGVSVAKRPAPARKLVLAGARTPDAKKASPSNRKQQPVDSRERRRKEIPQKDSDYHEHMRRVQQERWQRQQIERINKARETGWKSVLGADEKEEKPRNPMQKYEERKISPRDPPAKPTEPSAAAPRNVVENKPLKPLEQLPAREVPVAVPEKAPERYAGKTSADERARLVQEYWQRKNEAAANKARGSVDMFGNRRAQYDNANNNKNKLAEMQNKAPMAVVGISRAHNNDQKNYLAQLEAIRRENFYERRALKKQELHDNPKQQVAAEQVKGDPRFDPEARKKKIMALKEQAEQRAELLRKQLQMQREAVAAKYQSASKLSVVSQQKVIENPPQPVCVPKQDKEPRIPSGAQFAKADVGVDTIVSQIGRPHLFRSCSEGDLASIKEMESNPRKVWRADAKQSIPFAMLPLEATASQMEATNAGAPEMDHAPRRLWGKSGQSQVISVLNKAEILSSQAFSTLYKTGFQLPNSPAEKSTKVEAERGADHQRTFATYRVSDTPSNKDIPNDVQSPMLGVTVIRNGGKTEDTPESVPIVTGLASKSSPNRGVSPASDSSSGVTTSSLGKVKCAPAKDLVAEDESGELHLDMAPVEEQEKILFAKAGEPIGKGLAGEELVIIDELEEEEEDHPQSLQLTESNDNDGNGVASALKTGFFDTQRKLLRTCSMPDLGGTRDSYVIIETPVKTRKDTESNDKVPECGIGDNIVQEIVDDGDEDDEDIEEEDDEDEECGELSVDSDEEVQDFEEMINSMKDLLKQPAPSPIMTKLDIADDSEGDQDRASTGSGVSNLNEDWDSDDGESDKPDEDHDALVKNAHREEKRQKFKEDMFSRIEESRSGLEEELGLDKFMEVYQYVQRMQDNENDDATIAGGDQSPEIVDLLGTDKEYVYQKILYLVMAESAYFEDNE